MNHDIRIGMLGFGTVGTGTYRMLVNNRDAITNKVGHAMAITRIGIRDSSKERSLDASVFTTDLDSIVADPNIDVVCELIGGVEPAAELVERALMNGKHVVTANKELIAKHGSRLVHLAKSRGLDLHYEAAVGGGIPLVQPLKHQLAGNDVIRMMGILNGTSNYILTKMEQEGADFADALREAQAAGYAEADPTNDVEGIDTSYKISILASIAFGKQVLVEDIYREGISKVGITDIEYAKSWNYRIKLVGVVDAVGGDAVCVRVHPTMIPLTHPLASVNGVYNALWLNGDFVGDVMFSGRGAGSDPTGSAVIGDLIDVGRNMVVGGSGSAIPYDTGMKTVPIDDVESAFYMRLRVLDRPKTLGEISMVFGEFGISIAEMQMKTLPNDQGEIVFLTHRASERDFAKALEQVGNLDAVAQVAAVIRVEDKA
ncbi:MAG: homoserine dehydrogenase [Armatimonadetes bacterium]|nr:homoserine dehydrogenase [Armatimonadota bacterium]MBS1727318.1 homoserine dehydrogenase [Armatimonadota bacterium]